MSTVMYSYLASETCVNTTSVNTRVAQISPVQVYTSHVVVSSFLPLVVLMALCLVLKSMKEHGFVLSL